MLQTSPYINAASGVEHRLSSGKPMRSTVRRRFCARRSAASGVARSLPLSIKRRAMARYLIAGAAGYVGSRLAEQLLTRGESVRGLVRNPDDEVVERLAAMGMAVWQADLTQPES